MRRLTILFAAAAALMLIPAAQAFGAGTVTVIPAGEGDGEISSVGGSPEFSEFYGPGTGEGTPAIECAYASETPTGTCEGEADEAEPGFYLSSLLFAPAPGSEFAELVVEGDLSKSAEGGGPCAKPNLPEKRCNILSTTEDVTVIPVFIECQEGSEEPTCAEGPEEFPLTLNINGGEGTVVSDPAGIECIGAAPESCEAEFEENAEVTLTASPAAGYRFQFWGSCPSPEARKCTVTMNEAKEVKAFFVKTWDLTIAKPESSLPGIIEASPPGDSCLYYCSQVTYSYQPGAEITLGATTYGAKHLVEYTGGTGAAAACNGETTCSFTIGEEDIAIEGLFGFDAKAELSLQKAGGGTASIRAFNGFKCRNTCGSASAEYFEGPSEEVQLFWTLATGTNSIDFGTGAGSCTGESTEDEGSCSVTMDEAHELTATLE